jgi:N-acetylglucosaminyldiphosphoundecaprenol N-acetyl-beta-D-mannosaminyltransferase
MQIMASNFQIPPRTSVDAADLVVPWPNKYDRFGTMVSATSYDKLVDVMTRAAIRGASAVVAFHAVHAIIESTRDFRLPSKVNRFDAVATDGHPTRWALNHLHCSGLKDRVYGPESMARLCARAALESVPI